MTEEKYIPTKTEFLVDLLTGDASYSSAEATVQRSHRFPLGLFLQIENMARMGGVPVSLIINQLLECGLDAVLHELPEEAARQVSQVTLDQVNRPTVLERVEAKSRIARTKTTSKLTRAK